MNAKDQLGIKRQQLEEDNDPFAQDLLADFRAALGVDLLYEEMDDIQSDAEAESPLLE